MLGSFVASGPAINAEHAGMPVPYPQSFIPGGRLTLTQGTAVTTAEVTAAGTIYYEPFRHNRFPVFDGERIKLVSFKASTISLALTLTSGSVYDVYGYWDGAQLKLGLSAAWTSTTSRGTAAPITTLTGNGWDGFMVNSLALPGIGPKMGTLLGSVYAGGTNTTDDRVLKRFVSNIYNKVPRKLWVTDSRSSWTSTNSSWHSLDGALSGDVNRAEIVLSLLEEPVFLVHLGAFSMDSGTLTPIIGIGLDTTSADTSDAKSGVDATNTFTNGVTAIYNHVPSTVGYHYLQLLEMAGAANTTTFAGYNAAAGTQGGNRGCGGIGHVWG